MKIFVTKIDYCIDYSDTLINEEDYALYSDYAKACDDEINKIEDELPAELTFDVSKSTYENEDMDELLADKISEVTGWLVNGFHYEVLEDKT